LIDTRGRGTQRKIVQTIDVGAEEIILDEPATIMGYIGRPLAID